MTRSVWGSVSIQRVVVAVSVAVLVGATTNVRAQQAATQDPAQASAAKQPEDPFKLTSDQPTLIILQVKPEKAADFASMWEDIKAGLSKSQKPDVKAFADTLKVSRVDIPEATMAAQPSAPAIFLIRCDPASTQFSYNPVPLIYTYDPDVFGKREDQDKVYDKMKDALVSYNIWKLKKVIGG